LPQPIKNTGSRLVKGALVLEQVVIPVCSVHKRMELERELRGIDA